MKYLLNPCKIVMYAMSAPNTLYLFLMLRIGIVLDVGC
jgi:hypothetical protein